MIRFLANLFREILMIIGATAPPADQDERSQRKFVFITLAIMALVTLLCVALFFLIPLLYTH